MPGSLWLGMMPLSAALIMVCWEQFMSLAAWPVVSVGFMIFGVVVSICGILGFLVRGLVIEWGWWFVGCLGFLPI